MIGTLNRLGEQYAAALEDYLAGAGEMALHFAYELGRRAIADGIGVLEMVSIHNKALAAVFGGPVTREQALKMAERASGFFAESLAPFEMVLRGFREANASLHSTIEQIQVAEIELQRQNQQLVSAQQCLDAERRRYQDLFDFAPDTYLVTNLEGIIQEANKPAAAMLRMSQEALQGESLPGFVMPEERGSLETELAWLRKGALEKLSLWQVAIQPPGGDAIAVALTVGAVRDSQGTLTGLRWLLRDITERKEIEEERGRLRIREHLVRIETEATRRLRFLAEASTTLAGSLHYQSIPGGIASVSVPYLADCCFVYLTDGSMMVRHFAAAHKDPSQSEKLSGLQEFLTDVEMPSAIAAVLRSGKPEIVPHLSQGWLEAFAGPSVPLETLSEMNFSSAMLAPLIARGQLLGVIAFLAGCDRDYTHDDLALADELAHRCALILENARLYHEVVTAKDRAEKASQAREEFVAILSHELRTPLMTILGWAAVLQRHSSIGEDRTVHEGVRSLEHNAQTIARLVEDCLDVARISEGKIRLRKEIVDLNQVAAAAFDATRGLAAAKNIRFETAPAPMLNVWGDRTRLEEVLLNLLTNAIKYTPTHGAVTLALRRAGNEVQVDVKDTGIGIEPDFLEQIFQPFRQGTLNWYASKSGLGLGLAIAREIVEMHGGRIWADSEGPGCGSTFRLQLPLAAAQADEQRLQRKRPPAVRRSPLRILFIEDSKDILNLIKTELEALGYSVLIAGDGKTGLHIAERELPDVIVSDIKMPGFDGYELIKQVRQISPLMNTPAIALTGFGMKKDIEKALAAGYNAHLCKPAEADDIADLIEQLIR